MPIWTVCLYLYNFPIRFTQIYLFYNICCKCLHTYGLQHNKYLMQINTLGFYSFAGDNYVGIIRLRLLQLYILDIIAYYQFP